MGYNNLGKEIILINWHRPKYERGKCFHAWKSVKAFQQYLHSFSKLQQKTFTEVNMVHLEITDILNETIRKMENSQSSPFRAKVTSTPKYDRDNNSTQVMDRTYTPLTVTNKTSVPEESQKLRDDPAKGEHSETYYSAASETPGFPLVAESKQSNSSEPCANEYPPVSTTADVQYKNILKYTSCHDSQPKYNCVSFESDNELEDLPPLHLKEKKSDTEEKMMHLRKTDLYPLNNSSSQSQCMDRSYRPLTITEKSEKLCNCSANAERAEKYHNSPSESKSLYTINSVEPYSKEFPDLAIRANVFTSYHNSRPKSPFVSFESDDELEDLLKHQKLSPGQLNRKDSITEERQFELLRITDISSPLNENSLLGVSANTSHLMCHAKDPLTEPTNNIHGNNQGITPSQHQSKTSLIKPQTEISRLSLNDTCWDTRNTEQCENDDCMGKEATLEQVVHFKHELEKLENQMKILEDGDIATINTIISERVLKIQELRNSLIKSDKSEVRDQRLRNENFGFQRMLEQLHRNTQFLLDENFYYRREISELRTAKAFLQLKLSSAEQDGEDYVQEIKFVADKCEELLNQRKHILDERNFLSIEKQFLMKEIEVLKKEMNKKLEELASVTIEKENLIKVLSSTKARLVSCTKEKQELQSKLTKALIETCLLRRKLDGYEIQQISANRMTEMQQVGTEKQF
ncbi:uncharacterized protein LOC134923475 isoform X3 [Pseudophryne corroboree]|uniref:uncharacterized protein LOC134923475 isoform X3 n=1 Tax=Pseudophryne corroboree TaxID=495146 RepID=UPI00308214BC